MIALTVGRDTVNAAGEPVYRAARRMRLEIEAQLVAHPELAEDGAALQIVGLLLQVEGLDRHRRSSAAPIEPTPLEPGPGVSGRLQLVRAR